MRAATTAILAGLAALGAGACDHSHGITQECQRDDQCGADQACTAGTCLPLAAPPAALGVEVAPLSSSASGLLELKGTPTPLKLMAPDKLVLAGTLSPEAGATAPTTAHVVLSVPAAIPGRPDLQFETELVAPNGGASVSSFMLLVPGGTTGRVGTLRIVPTGADVATHAPVTLAVTVGPTLDLVIPSSSFTVQGRLRTAVGDFKSGQVARAFQGGALVSNVDVTGADGTFTLVVPATRVGPAPSQAISVQLAPAPGNTSEPVLTTKPFPVTANVDLGDLRLPASILPNTFRFTIRAGTETGPPVPGTIVHAQTSDDAATGTATFVREATTDGMGLADLALLPGSTTLRNYEVAIVPPTGSAYATKCMTTPIAAGGTAAVPAVLPSVVLQRRTVVNQTVFASDGRTPASNVMVVATLTKTDPNVPCVADVATRPPTVTTDAQGNFSLLLDPGTYTFDYDPPAGAPIPRQTEPGVPVPASGFTVITLKPETLPGVASVAEGTAVDASGLPLPLASVRFFEIACDSPETCTGPGRVAPTLRAEARTDAAGHFRAVFAAP